MLVFGIESTCDETACAIVENGHRILSNVVASQIDVHEKFGGVVPELACRRHIDLIIPVMDQALREAGISLQDLDVIAVAHGPGLIGALLIGLNTAKALSLALQKPFIAINHVEAHLYAALMSHEEAAIEFPCLGVVLSGGHTTLLLIEKLGEYKLIGETVDDAMGEAFDKAAKMIGLPYPGGPEIERLAKEGNPFRHSFKGGQVKGRPLDFSFSGLKTAVLYALKALSADSDNVSKKEKADLAASFQRAAIEDVVKKTMLAAARYHTRTILFGGGVTNNQALRLHFAKENHNQHRLIWPSIGLSLDNAAMIAGLGYYRYHMQGKGDSMDLLPMTRIPFTRILEEDFN